MSVNAVSMRSCVLPINLFIIHDGGTNCFASVPGIRSALTTIYKKVMSQVFGKSSINNMVY